MNIIWMGTECCRLKTQYQIFKKKEIMKEAFRLKIRRLREETIVRIIDS